MQLNRFVVAAIIGTVAASFTYGVSKAAADTQVGFCEEQLESIQTSDLQVAGRISRMLELESRCAGTGLYEYRLGKHYISARDYENATESIIQGLDANSPYDKELLLAKGDIYLHQRKYEKAATSYSAVAKAFPGWYAGHDNLGFALFAQGLNDEAISSLQRAVALRETASSYRTLTLAYYLNSQFRESTQALDRAYSLDESILADRDPMVAAIRSYAELGKYEVSYGLLGTLLQKNPGMREDPEYIKAGLFLREKMRADGLIIE